LFASERSPKKGRMEHRHGKRKLIDMETLLYRHGLPVAWGRTVNIGPGGAFVRFRNSRMINDYTLEVEFTATGDGCQQKYRTEAVVVHRSKAGIGIMFDSHDRNVVNALHRLAKSET